ncbi:hypothetical protein Pf1_01075 [Flavobacterium columnare]|nr:hypothetical protein Pf1_01075 [Flavobacterium columnare]
MNDFIKQTLGNLTSKIHFFILIKPSSPKTQSMYKAESLFRNNKN